MKRSILFLTALFCFSAYAQTVTQNVRGTVVDSESQFPLIGAKVKVLRDSGKSVLGGVCDANGKFNIPNVPVGKYPLQISSIGYTVQTQTIIVSSGKETVVNILLEESSIMGNEVVVTSKEKGETINEMATVSAQTFSVEETNRYAGSRGDPARMMANYAGVQGTDDSRNDIVVRGNSPLGILYRVEGINIPNPNHFGIAGSTGGPVSILNNKFLDNSEFFMSAFPAEYGNSTSGVFDLRVRKGNDNIHEFTGQFGFLGTEALFEGPLNREKGSSYLVMGRFSTLQLMSYVGIQIGTDAVPVYGDGAFKFFFPLKKGGQLSIWGMGGASTIDIFVSDQIQPAQDAFGEQDRDQFFRSSMNTTGITYKKPLNKNTLFKASISYNYQNQNSNHEYVLRSLDSITNNWIYNDPKAHDMMGYTFTTHNQQLYLSLNHKIKKKHVLKYGLNFDLFQYNMRDSILEDITDPSTNWNIRWDFKSSSPDFMIQPFLQWKYKPIVKLTMTAGLHAQYFSLTNAVSYAEPRVGLKYDINKKQSISLGAGMHSQKAPDYIYLYHQYDNNGNKVYHNSDLGFSRAIHGVLGWQGVWKKTLFKAEAYYQQLYDVPVEVQASSFSLLNQGSGFARFFPDSLENTGTGRNFGLDLTIQKFFNNDFHFMLTGSIFDSKYIGSDGIQYNTDFNGNYIANFLIGKEFHLGKKKKNMIGIGAKITVGGGPRFGIVDSVASDLQKEIIFLDEDYNSFQFDPYFRADLKLNWVLNAKKTTHEIGLDLVNLTGQQNVLGLTYAPGTENRFSERYQLGFLPIFYYKIDFKVAGKKESSNSGFRAN